jgi:AsmA protein
MSRRRRWLIGILVVVVALPLALVALVAFQLAPGRLRPRIERLVLDATGAELHIDGALEWDAWPDIRVSTGAVRVLVPGAQPLARWRALEATAHWRPLLESRIRIESLTVDGLEVVLHRGADGAIEWPKIEAAGAAAAGDGAAGDDLGTATLARLELVDATLRIEDAKRGVALDGLQFRSGVEIDTATGVLRLHDVTLRGTAHAAPLPAAGVPVALSTTQLTLRPRPLQLEAAPLTAQAAGLAVDLRLDGAADVAAPAAAGRLHAAAPSARELARALGVELPPTRDAGVFGPMEIEAVFRVDADAFVLDPLRAQLDGSTFTGTARAPLAGDQPAQFTLAGERLDLDRYLRPKDQPGEPFELPVALLRALRIEGELTLKEARLAGATARGVRLKVIDHAGGKRP